MNSKDIIKEAKRQLGNVSQPKFAETTGFDIDRVKNLESGRVSKFTDEEIEILVKFTTLTKEDIIISQVADRKIVDLSMMKDAMGKYTNSTFGDGIPVYHRQNINGAGGYGALNDDESAEIIMVSEQMLRAMFGLSTFENLDIINVTGNSMKPIVEDGDTIMVRRTNEVKNNQIAVVRVSDQLYIKYYQRHPLGKWVKLSSEDKENYPDMDFEGEEVNEVHVVGELIGKFKPY